MLSERQRPVVQHLTKTMEVALGIACAIADNAVDEQIALPGEYVTAYQNDLNRILSSLRYASNPKGGIPGSDTARCDSRSEALRKQPQASQ